MFLCVEKYCGCSTYLKGWVLLVSWRVGDRSSIKIKFDRWIPNYPAHRVLHSASVDVDVDDWFISELIDQDLHWWKRDLMSTIFHREDMDAICRIPLSRRQVGDSIFWVHIRNGGYSVKSGYHVACEVLKHEGWAECSCGGDMQQVWQALWKMRVPNKIKIFGWRVFHGILPTWFNLGKKKIIRESVCPICTRLPENELHVFWEYPTAQDVWAGSRIKIQKCNLGQHDMVQLFQYLLDRLDTNEVELFFIQA